MKTIFTKQEIINLIETSLSWMVAFMMLTYGFGKIAQFNGASDIEKTIPELTGMQLMWAFYGYSFSYTLIIGFLEILGAILIFFNRTRIIGCILTSTILVNIILQDIFFNVLTGALLTAVTLQLFVLAILWINKSKIISVLKIITTHNKSKDPFKKRIATFTITFIGFIILWILQHNLISFISHNI